MSDILKDKEMLVFKVLAEREGKLLSAIAGMNCYWRHRNNSDMAQLFVQYELNKTALPIHGTKLLAFTDIYDAKIFTNEVDDTYCSIYLCRAGNPMVITSIPHPGEIIYSTGKLSDILLKWNEIKCYPDNWHGKTLNNTVGVDWLIPLAKLDMSPKIRG